VHACSGGVVCHPVSHVMSPSDALTSLANDSMSSTSAYCFPNTEANAVSITGSKLGGAMVVARVVDGATTALETGDWVDDGNVVVVAEVTAGTVANDGDTVDSPDGDDEESCALSPQAATTSRPATRTNRPSTVRRILPELKWDCQYRAADRLGLVMASRCGDVLKSRVGVQRFECPWHQ